MPNDRVLLATTSAVAWAMKKVAPTPAETEVSLAPIIFLETLGEVISQLTRAYRAVKPDSSDFPNFQEVCHSLAMQRIPTVNREGATTP